MREPCVALSFGGCTTHEDDRQVARQALHDDLLATWPVRLGPVEWRHYAPEEAEPKLRQAGLIDHPNAAGLLEFLRTTPDSELVIASVLVPPEASA